MAEKINRKKATSSKKQYSAPALEKGLAIIELLSNEINGLNIGEITQKLGKSVGELFRMLAVLEQQGYIELPPSSDKYVLTLKLFGIANRFPPVKRLTSIASSIMRQLSDDIEQSCHLVIYYQGKGHVVVQQDPPSEIIFSVRLGAEVPLMNSASGHVLMAFSGDETSKMMMSNIPKDHPKPNKRSFQKILERVVDQGYELIESAKVQGVQDIGYPIFDNLNQVVGVLTIPFLDFYDSSHLITLADAKLKISLAAQQISEKLGCT